MPHSRAAPVKIAARVGAQFAAVDGALSGTILQLAPNRLIGQSWRSTQFGKRDIDATLVLSFWPDPGGGRIELTHVNVADSDLRSSRKVGRSTIGIRGART